MNARRDFFASCANQNRRHGVERMCARVRIFEIAVIARRDEERVRKIADIENAGKELIHFIQHARGEIGQVFVPSNIGQKIFKER